MNYFKELKVWQKAIELVTNTYLKTQSFHAPIFRFLFFAFQLAGKE